MIGRAIIQPQKLMFTINNVDSFSIFMKLNVFTKHTVHPPAPLNTLIATLACKWWTVENQIKNICANTIALFKS